MLGSRRLQTHLVPANTCDEFTALVDDIAGDEAEAGVKMSTLHVTEQA